MGRTGNQMCAPFHISDVTVVAYLDPQLLSLAATRPLSLAVNR